MWTLIFVFSMYEKFGENMATVVIPNLKTEQSCLIAQKALIEQATRRKNHIQMNMCVKGE